MRGPFAKHTGLYLGMSARDRVRVLLSVMGGLDCRCLCGGPSASHQSSTARCPARTLGVGEAFSRCAQRNLSDVATDVAIERFRPLLGFETKCARMSHC